MESNERAYLTNEVAERLEIGESTLRKWCLALEEQGHSFIKGEQERRLFLESDILLLSEMKNQIRNRNKSMEVASILALEQHRTRVVPPAEPRTDVVPVEQQTEIFEQIASVLQEQQQNFELQMKQQEQLFAEKMQEVLAEQTKLIEREMSAKFNHLEESNKRIEDLLTAPKKPWYKFW